MSRYRFATLLASLSLVVFARPFFTEAVFGLALIDVLTFITLLTGAYATIGQRRILIVVIALAACSGISQAAFLLNGSPLTARLFLVAGLLFYGGVTLVLLRALFGQQARVTSETLCQAFAVYLLLGLIGAMGYALLELAAPGSFIFPPTLSDDAPEAGAHFERFLGFSFTTLTTLGYGTIAPATPRADAMTSFQAVVSQVYLAVVIARLVAIQVGQHAEAQRQA